jgi:two-component system chemotaxis response regulator CheB
MKSSAIVLGGSAGAADALVLIVAQLPEDFPAPLLVVQHLHPSDDGSFARHLARTAHMPVVEPCDKEPIQGGRIYAAPAGYHMLAEKEQMISLSVDPKVNWSRPSIDVLFESAARAWPGAVVAVILSGANDDGARGMRAVKESGGHTIAQDPEDAQSPVMPQAAINTGAVDEVLPAAKIGRRLIEICDGSGAAAEGRDNKGTGFHRGKQV